MKKILVTISFILLSIVVFAQVPLEVGKHLDRVLSNINGRNNVYQNSFTTDSIPVVTEVITEDIVCAYYFNKKNVCYFQKSFYPINILNAVYKDLQQYVYYKDNIWFDLVTNVMYELVIVKDKGYFRIDCVKVDE